MAEENKNSILLVDDSPVFRKIVTSLLNTLNLTVIQASSRKEATNIVNNGQPALAIVDYNLPDGDGITWISEIRTAGKNMPIVFVSASFCDAKTFNLLRNILKVSLVLQKPIAPELFLQQLDGILPFSSITQHKIQAVNPKPSPIKPAQSGHLAEALNIVHKEYERLLKEFPQAKEQLDEVLSEQTGASEAWLMSRFKQLAKKLQLQNALAAARKDYLSQLPGLWHEMSKNIAGLRENPSDQILKGQIINEAHKLRGAAGTLGLGEIGRAAGEIEEFLRNLGAAANSEHKAAWDKIISAQSTGEKLIKVQSDGQQEKAANQTFKECNLLILTADNLLRKQIGTMPALQAHRFYYADASTDALLLTKTVPLTGIIIDLRCPLDRDWFQICKELRESPGAGSLPLMAIADNKQPVNKDEMAYLGFSSLIRLAEDKANDEKTIAEGVNQLLKIGQLTKGRVLIVDDDKALCQFISSVLQTEDMICQSLTEPIEIMEELDSFRPNIVILDVNMPGLSGYDVCRLLRANPAWQDLVIIFLTARHDNEGRMAAFVAGADDFLAKPILGEELIVRLKNHMERFRLKQRRTKAEDLTGHPLRKAYLNDLQKSLTHDSGKGSSGCLCMLEIEGFDQIAQEKGFAQQDRLLEKIGILLQCRFKGEVKRGRFSDNIFLLTFPENDKKSTEQLMKMFNREITASNRQQAGQEGNISLSWALAEFPTEANSIPTILELLSGRLAAVHKEKLSAVTRT